MEKKRHQSFEYSQRQNRGGAWQKPVPRDTGGGAGVGGARWNRPSSSQQLPLPHLGGASYSPDLGRKGADPLGRKSQCIVGSPGAAESNLNESGAPLRTRVELLSLGSGLAC